MNGLMKDIVSRADTGGSFNEIEVSEMRRKHVFNA